MTILSIPWMIFSLRDGWNRLTRKSWPPRFVFALALLLSLLPPFLLYHAGSRYGDDFVPGYGGKPWEAIAIAFFATEALSFAVMGLLIRAVAAGYGIAIRRRDAWLLAAAVPIPLWLASLALLVPNLAFNMMLALLGLAASCNLLYQGVREHSPAREPLEAAAVVQTVMGAVLVLWAGLPLFVQALP